MSGNDERVKKRTVYGVPPDVVDEYHRRWIAQSEERETRHAYEHAEQMMERRGPRLRERITQAVLGLLAVILGNCLGIVLAFVSGNLLAILLIGSVCGTQSIFWFLLILDEMGIRDL